ncbi:MAG TPA: hypothetical protein VIJ27_07265 [Mucilaginibacter sp.]
MKEQVKKKKLFTWILYTGLLTGTVDILFAFIINYHVPKAIILKFIASGLFGKAAFSPGTEMVYYGLLLHYCIAFIWTTIFFFFHAKLLSMLKVRFILVVITGLVIWTVMNLVVVPLSRIPPQKFHALGIIEDMAALILAYGLLITLIANRFYNTTSSN